MFTIFLSLQSDLSQIYSGSDLVEQDALVLIIGRPVMGLRQSITWACVQSLRVRYFVDSVCLLLFSSEISQWCN